MMVYKKIKYNASFLKKTYEGVLEVINEKPFCVAVKISLDKLYI